MSKRIPKLCKYCLPSLAILCLAMDIPAAGSADETIPSVDSQVVMFYYKDIDAPAAFYGETLGFARTFDEDWVKIFQISDTSSVGVVREGEGAYHTTQAVNAVMLSITTREVDAWYERVLAAGDVKILTPIHNSENAPIRAFLVEDPGGYTVEFFQWLDEETK